MAKKNSKTTKAKEEGNEARDARLAKEAAKRLEQFHRDYPHRRPGIHTLKVGGGKVPLGLDRSCYSSKDTKTFKTEVWQDGVKVDSFTGILQEAAAAEFIKLLEAGATKASPVKCKADGASLTYKDGDSGRLQIPAPFTPCIFPK